MTSVVIVPGRSGDEVDEALRSLTRAIHAAGLGELVCGALGGTYGYGVAFENDVFMMHPYCWCEREDCPWCAGCECPASAHHYLVDGQEVTRAQWMDFFCLHVYGVTNGQYEAMPFRQQRLLRPENFDRLVDEANARRTQVHDPVCRVCRGEFGNAPNFLHKPSGSRVNWYKWIGRSMETKLAAPWADVLRECMESIGVRA